MSGRPEYGRPDTWPRIGEEQDPPVLDVTPDPGWPEAAPGNLYRPGVWAWLKCRVLGAHSPSRLAIGTCPCQKRGRR